LPPQEIFLSHSDRDRTFVVRLAETLRRHGLPVWYSNTDIVGAQQWHDEIGSALRRCDWFVLVLSPGAVNSTWVKRELLFALQQNRLDERIVPLMFESCDYGDLSWTLSGFQMIDFRQDFEQGARDLMLVWGLGYRPE
jgi:hypothetical protein